MARGGRAGGGPGKDARWPSWRASSDSRCRGRPTGPAPGWPALTACTQCRSSRPGTWPGRLPARRRHDQAIPAPPPRRAAARRPRPRRTPAGLTAELWRDDERRTAAAAADQEPEAGQDQDADQRPARCLHGRHPQPATPGARSRATGPGCAAALLDAREPRRGPRPAGVDRPPAVAAGEKSSGLSERTVSFASPAPADAVSGPTGSAAASGSVTERAAASAAMAALIRASKEAGRAGLRTEARNEVTSDSSSSVSGV